MISDSKTIKTMIFEKKRSFYSIRLVRKFDEDDKAKDLAEMAGITPAYLSKIETKQSDPSVTVAWYLATLKGLRIDDVLNLDSGLDRLIREQRPLFRVPDTIKKSHIREQFAKWNSPSELKDNYYLPGNHINRCSMMVKTARKMAEGELLTNEFKGEGLAEFVIPKPNAKGRISELTDEDEEKKDAKPVERLNLGEAFEAFTKSLDLSNNAIAQKVGSSRSFVSSIETDKNEVSVGNLDQVTDVLGITVDELIFVARPSKIKWMLFVQAGEYQNQAMARLMMNPETLKAFRKATVMERAEMMLGYRAWLKAEAETALTKSELEKRFMLVPPVFQTLYL